MKVIAINNAPNVDTKIDCSWAKKFNIERAYYKGDIFNTSPEYNKLLVIFNHYVNEWMEVNKDNFITLEQWREKQINKIIK